MSQNLQPDQRDSVNVFLTMKKFGRLQQHLQQLSKTALKSLSLAQAQDQPENADGVVVNNIMDFGYPSMDLEEALRRNSMALLLQEWQIR